MIQDIVVLGGGTAGLTAALTLKRRLPQLNVRVVRSPEIGVIGVGESTNMVFPKHFLKTLAIPLPRLMKLIDPTLKLGIRFLWGPRPEFHYAFAFELAVRHPALKRSNAAYREDGQIWTGPVSALMAHELAFHRGPNGKARTHKNFAFHIENPKMVAGLEVLCQEDGVSVRAERYGKWSARIMAYRRWCWRAASGWRRICSWMPAASVRN
jgi:tryptophan 7-halogenase